MSKLEAEVLDRSTYYADYWADPLHAENGYLRWKAGVTASHAATRACHSLLDVGCGPGAILAAVGRPGVRLCGVEFSEDAARFVTSRGFEGCAVDLERQPLPYADETFDVVVCFDVLEHLFSPGALLAEICRVLAPGGRAFLCVPNSLNAFNRLLFAAGHFTDIMDSSHHTEEMFSNHIRLFSKALFERFLTAGRFRPVERHFYFPTQFTDPSVRVPKNLAKAVTTLGLHEALPSLVALAFLYVCEKS